MMNEKITDRHLQRKAMLYIRQSSTHQVAHHQEGRRLQYAMKERLQQLGWSEIEVIDEDLGRSASGNSQRTGFERMVAEVSLDRVGAVAAREVSRFARNSRDWQQLVEVCRVVDTLLVDQEAIYDPRRSNDRLLLGLKGSLNEYELDLLRHRAQEARREKARRGELIVVPPVGYVQGEEGTYEKDPDLRVQQAIRQVFEKFLELGSVRQVLFWFVENDLQLPTQHCGLKGWETRWRRPNYAAIYRVLTHPIYAGAYAYGMTQTETVWVQGKPRKTRRFRPREQWLSLLPGRHEGYLGWEQFQEIQKMIARNANWPSGESCGAAKGGAALLAGMLRCGRCGRKLTVHYTGREENVMRYNCCRGALDNGVPRCINFGGTPVDEAIGREILKVLRPAAVEAALEAARNKTREKGQVLAALQLELQAARYSAERAEKQYDSSDPQNRLVADELERRWNRALERVSELESRVEQEQKKRQTPSLLPAEKFESLAGKLEEVWSLPDTDARLKKRIIRTLIEEIIVDVCAEAGEILLTIHWKGGIHSKIVVPRRRRGQNSLHTAPSIVEAVRALIRISSDEQIAAWLNRNNLFTGHGNRWTQAAVASLRKKRNLPEHSAEHQKREGWMTLTQAASFLGISTTSLRLAVEHREIEAIHPLPDGPWIFLRAELQRDKAQKVVERIQLRKQGATEPNSQQRLLIFPTT
jgi:DNA invertase Pin-like site-specific DNA recombinase